MSASTDGSVCVCSSKGVLVTRLKLPKAEHEASAPLPSDCCLDLGGSTENVSDWATAVEAEGLEQMEEEVNSSKLSGVTDLMQKAVLIAGFSDGLSHIWKPFLVGWLFLFWF